MDDDSGVAVYDVQVKVDDGAWTAWLTATTATEAMYSGELGHLYTFRARATDHVSNTGPWAEASTTVVQVTKYYAFGGQRIAVRQAGVVYYIHTDHLGSTSLVTDHASRITAPGSGTTPTARCAGARAPYQPISPSPGSGRRPALA